MIIAILTGMSLIATGSATDQAEAVKVINDIRSLKMAALLYYIDNMSFPTQAAGLTSLDIYMDRPLMSATPPRYSTFRIVSGVNIAGSPRTLIGVGLTGVQDSQGVKNKLKFRAHDTGLYNSTGSAYNGENEVFMNMI
jgi:general secretion pathway protein G